MLDRCISEFLSWQAEQGQACFERNQGRFALHDVVDGEI
jgi:hypothetical protein